MVDNQGILGSKNIKIMKTKKSINWTIVLHLTSICELIESRNV